MNALLCKLFGHIWVHKWHRHNCYYASSCKRCGTQIHRINHDGLMNLIKDAKNQRRLEYIWCAIMVVVLFVIGFIVIKGV